MVIVDNGIRAGAQPGQDIPIYNGYSNNLPEESSKSHPTNGGRSTGDEASQINGHSSNITQNWTSGWFNGQSNGYSESSDLQNGYTTQLEIICGPLINYKHMDVSTTGSVWNGSILIVTKPGSMKPILELGPSDEAAQTRKFQGAKLYQDVDKAFWQFVIDLPLSQQEARWQYSIFNARKTPKLEDKYDFFVPAASDSMRIMFHSCNGFSIGTDEEAWSGTALWNDVNRKHKEKPFHVMIGGGDQIYNDNVRVTGPLSEWTEIANPIKRREYQFSEEIRVACDEHYYQNYINWYNLEPFATANARIPQLNIWDDHDIIDGFGSYTDHFMQCHVFRGIGGVAFKYYSLFQHHIAPPAVSFTSDDPKRRRAIGPDVFVAPQKLDSSFIEGGVGPYIEDKSLSVYARLGAGIAFLGIDARMERTRHQINYPETYDKIFFRLKSEITKANLQTKQIQHLMLLLGVPIAYPRLVWLENIITSPLIGPIRFLNKRFGLAGGLFNKFDGQVDLLDDLDDHYTARQHKKERKELVLRLQDFAAETGVRVTILGGDVHLGAIGRFYTSHHNEFDYSINDERFMVNIISSAITNKPPPRLVADMLGKRNKVHRLDHHTHETLMPIFNKDPGGIQKNAKGNNVTMPSRNYAIISYSTGRDSMNHSNGNSNGNANGIEHPADRQSANGSNKKVKDGHSPLHAGEVSAGTTHPAADGLGSGPFSGGLDVCLRVEIDNHNKEGRTEGYGFSIPPLQLVKAT